MNGQFHAGLLIALLGAPMACSDVRYRIVSIGDFPGGPVLSGAADINNAGVATGVSYVSQYSYEAFVWSIEEGMRPLGSLPGCQAPASPRSINDTGQIVGTASSAAECRNEAFLYTPGVGMLGLGDLPGSIFSSGAGAINNLGHVVGGSHGQLVSDEPFFWSPETGMIALGLLPGWEHYSGGADDINDSDVVVGTSGPAFIWSAADGMRPVADLTNEPGFSPMSVRINNLGQIAGMYVEGDGWRGFLLEPDGTLIRWGQISENPDERVAVNDINDHGQVSGWLDLAIQDTFDVPFLWDRERGFRDVNTLLDPCIVLPAPYRRLGFVGPINNRGWMPAGYDLPPWIEMPGIVLIPYIPGDVDESGNCDLQDLAIQLSNFSRSGDAAYQHGDLDCDEDVDLQDLAILLANFGESLP